MKAKSRVRPDINHLINLLNKLKKQKGGEEKISEVINKWQMETQATIAQVSSVIPLNQEDLQEIQARLSLLLSKNVLVVNNLDKKILGGLRIIVDSKIIDCSLKSQLKELKN